MTKFILDYFSSRVAQIKSYEDFGKGLVSKVVALSYQPGADIPKLVQEIESNVTAYKSSWSAYVRYIKEDLNSVDKLSDERKIQFKAKMDDIALTVGGVPNAIVAGAIGVASPGLTADQKLSAAQGLITAAQQLYGSYEHGKTMLMTLGAEIDQAANPRPAQFYPTGALDFDAMA